MSASRSILIAGGGIAGLSAALSCAEAGFRVQVFEAAKKFQAIGAGIQIGPNACRILNLLGLSKTLNSVAGTPKGIDIRSALTGDVLNTVELGDKVRKKYDASYLTLNRADLHQVLYSACQAHQSITVNLDHRVDVVSQHKNGASIITTHKNDVNTVAGQFLIIADGVHSKLREMIEPDRKSVRAVHSGFAAWRGMLPVETVPEFLDMEYVHLCLSKNAHAVLYPVNRKRYLNMVFVTPSAKDKFGITQKANIEDLKSQLFYANEKSRWNDKFTELLSNKIDWSIWPILEMPKSPTWGDGSMLAIGDAAHAMPPFAGQGAAMAIEDGYELAQLLKQELSNDGLQVKFHALRVGRVNQMRNLTKSNVKMYHQGAPLSLVRDNVLKITPSAMLLMKQNWIYKWRPQG